jgi:hypothetical protein
MMYFNRNDLYRAWSGHTLSFHLVRLFPVPVSVYFPRGYSFHRHSLASHSSHTANTGPAFSLSLYSISIYYKQSFQIESLESLHLARAMPVVPCAMVHQQSYGFKIPLIPRQGEEGTHPCPSLRHHSNVRPFLREICGWIL